MNGLNSTSVYFDSGVNPGDKTYSNVALNNTLTVSMTGTSKGGNNTSMSIYVPQIRSKNSGEFVGLLEWKIEDEPKIIIKLIDGKSDIFLIQVYFFVGFFTRIFGQIHITRAQATSGDHIPAWFACLHTFYVHPVR